MEGKKFSTRLRHDVLVLIFWLGALEFKILKYLFVCCLNILLDNFPVNNSISIFQYINLEKYIANFFKGYILSQNKPNEFSSACITDLVPCLHLQFANLLEKQTSKKIYLFVTPGKYYLPLWRKNETTLLKLHAQLTCKQLKTKNNITSTLQ